MSPPPAGRSRWTTRLLAKAADLTSGCLSKLLRGHKLKPHLVRTYKVSNDPNFAANKRHGVLDLYTALEVATGQVTHDLREQHTARDFLSFMKKVHRRYGERELHVILDNSSTHGTPEVLAWLRAHPQVHFHYTPTRASWLNRVEGFFGILGKQSLRATPNFPSKHALRDHIAAYIKAWNRSPTPFQWTKPADAIIKSRKRMLDRSSRAVH